MNTANAWGFLLLGSLMNFMPLIAPSTVAAPVGPGDMSTATLWLHFMGSLVSGIGGAYLSRTALYHAPVLLVQLLDLGSRALRPVAQPVARVASAASSNSAPIGARVTAAF